MLRKKTNFTWGKNDDHWYSQDFHTRDKHFFENKKGTIKSFLHLTAMSELEKIQAIMLQ